MSGNDFWWVEYEAGPFSGVGVRLEANSIVTNSLVSSGDLSASSVTMPFQATGDVTNPDTSRGTLYVRDDDKPIYRTSSGSEYDLSASGETNTASNVGVGGVGVFKQKTGVNLEFRNINAGSNKITVTNDSGNNEIDVDVAPANITIGSLSGAPSGSVVGTSDGQALTNKTITDTTNNVAAKSLHSATTVVDVSAATAPSNGQVLTATSGTAATWQTPVVGASTLSAVLTAGNSAGSTSINMNSQNVTSIGQLSFTGDVIASGTTDKIQVGLSASAGTANSIAIGRKATTLTNANGIAIGGNDLTGNGPIASGLRSIAIGSHSHESQNGAVASGNRAIAIGSRAESVNSSTIAVGYYARAQIARAIAIGHNTRGSGPSGANPIAIGSGSIAHGNGTVAIGAYANSNGGMALGNSTTGGIHCLAISSATAVCSGSRSASIGYQAICHTTDSVALGRAVTTRSDEEFVTRGFRCIRASQTTSTNGTVTLLSYPMFASETSWMDAYITEREGNTVVSGWSFTGYFFYRQSTGDVLVDVGTPVAKSSVGATTTTAAFTAGTTTANLTITKDTGASRTYTVVLFVRCAPLT